MVRETDIILGGQEIFTAIATPHLQVHIHLTFTCRICHIFGGQTNL